MPNGRLKIKEGRKLELKANGKEYSIPKEYDLSQFPPGTYDCEVQLDGGKIMGILIEGKAVPKNEGISKKKEEQALKKRQEAEVNKGQEKQRRKEVSRPSSSSTSSLDDSYVQNFARVPSDTKERVVISSGEIDNFYLKLNKFARLDWHKDGQKFYFFNPKKIEEGPKGNKELKLPEFCIKSNFGSLFNSPSQIANRQVESAKVLFPNAGQLLSPKFKPEWRFVTGLGGHSVYETGITLHHIYGIPYIPASSIKGVLRSWVIFSKFGNNEGRAIAECEDFCKVFGCPAELRVGREDRKYQSIFNEARQGKVTFFDAFPTVSPTIEPDIMNPHYPIWYGGNGAPVDTESPNPVFFLTVKETPFQFLIGSKEWNLETETFWDGQTLGWWLENALAEHGIGAKTAVGYGYMKPTS